MSDKEKLSALIQQSMGFPPTAEQSRAIAVFADFYTDSQLSIVNYQLSIRPKAVMVLRGCAGTGKTTLAAAIVRALKALQQKMVLLAPTGRAAKRMTASV